MRLIGIKKFSNLLAVAIIIITLFGCSGNQGIPSSGSVNVGVTVTQLNLFEDHYGGQHIVGVIRNDNVFPVKSISLRISITDVDGETILRDARGRAIPDDLFQPFLSILFPGESSGFDYSLSPLTGTAANYQVTFSSAIQADAEEADVRMEHLQIQKSMYGTRFLMGEVVNHGSQPARVEGLGAALLGSSGQLLDANDATNPVLYLAPAKDPGGMDRFTFSIPLRGTFGDDVQWQTFLSSVITQKRYVPAVRVLESRHYVDAFGFFHLVGLMESTGSNPLSFPISGSLLDVNGNVLDSIEGYLPVVLQPGSVAGFDLVDWKVVNHNVDLQKRIKKTEIQIDPSRTYPSKLRYFQLIPSVIEESRNDQGVWTFQGKVNNFLPESFSGIVVIVSIFSGKDHLVATNYQWVQSFNPIIGGGRNSQFNLQVSLDPSRNPSNYTYQIQALAESDW